VYLFLVVYTFYFLWSNYLFCVTVSDDNIGVIGQANSASYTLWDGK